MSTEHDKKATSAKRKSSAFLRLGIPGLMLVLLAPSSLTLTGQHTRVVGFLNPELADAVSYSRVTTHWWAPVELRDVQLRDLASVSEDDQIEPVLEVARLTTRQPLWKLLLSGGKGAEITVVEPVVNVCMHSDRSNLELTLERILRKSEEPGQTLPVTLNIENGTVRFVRSQQDASADLSTAQIDGITGRISTINVSDPLPSISLAASVHNTQSSAQTGLPKSPAVVGQQRIAAKLDDVVGDQPILPFARDEVAGFSDRLSTQSVRVEIDPVLADTDGQRCLIELQGLELRQIQPIVQRLIPGSHWSGNVSGRLEGMISNDTKGFAGRAYLVGRSLRWFSDICAPGESVLLDEVIAQGSIAIAEDGMLVNSLKVQSSLLEMEGSGEIRLQHRDPVRVLKEAATDRSPSVQQAVHDAEAAATGRVRLNARVDLARIASMLPATLHLEDGVQIEQADLLLSCRLQSATDSQEDSLNLLQTPRAFEWQLAAQTSPVLAQRSGRQIEIPSAVRVNSSGIMSVSQFRIQQAELSGAFGQLNVTPEGNEYSISGDLSPTAAWSQFRSILSIPQPAIEGSLKFASHVSLSQDVVQLRSTTLSSPQLQIASPLLTINTVADPLQMVSGQLDVKGNSSALKTLLKPLHDATWLSDHSAVALRLDAEQNQRLRIEAAVIPQSSQSGHLANENTFVVDEARISGTLVAESSADTFFVDRAQIQLPGINAAVSGSVAARDGLLFTNLTADTTYDLEMFLQRVLSMNSDRIRVSGRGQETFTVRGCPSMLTTGDVEQYVAGRIQQDSAIEPLSMSGQLAWTGGSLYGMELGSGLLKAQVKDGLLRTEPVHCKVGTGDLDVMMQWDLRNRLIQLASGSRLQNLQLSPELCAEWLSYVAPMLSDTAEVEGKVSVRIQQFDYQTETPERSNIRGVVSIENASAQPGASLTSLTRLLELATRKSLADRSIVLPSQEVPVDFANGVVQHRDLAFDVSGYQIRSSGSVGLNRQIDLLLDIPLQESTLEQRGRSIRVPVTGTINNPHLSSEGLLQNLGQQQLQNQLDNQLDRGLNKLLDKLR